MQTNMYRSFNDNWGSIIKRWYWWWCHLAPCVLFQSNCQSSSHSRLFYWHADNPYSPICQTALIWHGNQKYTGCGAAVTGREVRVTTHCLHIDLQCSLVCIGSVLSLGRTARLVRCSSHTRWCNLRPNGPRGMCADTTVRRTPDCTHKHRWSGNMLRRSDKYTPKELESNHKADCRLWVKGI